MDLKNKLDYGRQLVKTIAEHDDEDLSVRKAVLEALKAQIETDIVAAQARADARLVLLGIVEDA